MALSDTILATQPASLKGYWKCDETSGTTVIDYSGNSKDLTLTGGFTLGAAGQSGTAITFNGSTGYASRGDAAIGSALPARFTMMVLVKGAAGQTGAAGTAAKVFAFGNSGDAVPMLDIGTGSSGQDPNTRCFFRRSSGSGQVNTPFAGVAFLNDWRLVIFRRDASNNWTTRTNDQPAASVSHTPSTFTINTTAIGAILRTSAAFFFNGSIQHVACWTECLTDAECDAIFAQTGLTASQKTPYGYVTSLGRSDANLASANIQGVAYDGTHYYISDSTTLYKYTRSGNTYTLVTSRSVAGDDPVSKSQINGMNYHDGFLWIGANNFSTTPKLGWALKYNPADLTWVSTHSVGANWSEGGAWRQGEYWAVYDDLKSARRYDSSFNLIGTYDLPLLVADNNDAMYQGAVWHGDRFITQIHRSSTSPRTDIHYWNGTSFDAFQSLGVLSPAIGGTSDVGQGLHWETINGVMLFCERGASDQRLWRATFTNGEQESNRRRRVLIAGAA